MSADTLEKSPTLNRHGDTALTLQQTGAQDLRMSFPFRPTYAYRGEYIDRGHHRLALSPLHETNPMINIGIDGWLLMADALKLYEMAYFCPGDILELGSYRGLSASLMAEAAKNSGRPFVIVSVDLDPASSQAARTGMDGRLAPGRENCHFFQAEATQFVRSLAEQGRRFQFAFVDHSHTYEHVRDSCAELHRVLDPGSFVLFHDYNDPRNAADSAPDYGVYQGVHDGLRSDLFEFWGVYGCTGLFRYRPEAEG